MLGQLANLGFVKTCLQKGGCDLVANGRLLPGTKIALIINIHAISDRNKAVLPRELLHGSEQLVFAMKATRRIIADIFGLFCFMCLDDLKRNPLLLNRPPRFGPAGIGPARAAVVFPTSPWCDCNEKTQPGAAALHTLRKDRSKESFLTSQVSEGANVRQGKR